MFIMFSFNMSKNVIQFANWLMFNLANDALNSKLSGIEPKVMSDLYLLTIIQLKNELQLANYQIG